MAEDKTKTLSNFYVLCCSCQCEALTVYRTVLIFDMLLYGCMTLSILSGVFQKPSTTTLIVEIVFFLGMLFVLYKAVIMFTNYQKYSESGCIISETNKYLSFKNIFLWVCIIVFILFSLLMLLAILFFSALMGNSTNKEEQDANTALKAFLTTALSTLVIFAILVTWFEINKNKSMREASDAMSDVVGGGRLTNAGPMM